jgi:RNase H-fold protein (predicted Holliday junction resolvase)
MRAKGITTTKVYKAHKDHLEKQIEVLEQHQTEKGLTVGEVLQMEMVIDNKRRHIRELEQAIEKDIQQAMVLSDQDKIAAAAAQSQEDIRRLEAWLEEERLSRQKSKR